MSVKSARLTALSLFPLALATAFLVGLGGQARGEEPLVPITAAANLNWGFKETWRNYAQRPQVSGGAEVVTPTGAASYDLEWEFESGSYDPASGTTRVSYRGSAHWQKYRASELGRPRPPGYGGPETDPYLLDVMLSDPQITISRDSSVLTVVATSRDQDTWELISYGRVPIVSLDLFAVTPTVAGGTTEWEGITAAVTSEGSAAMAGNYRVGQVVDPVGFAYAGPGGAPDFSEHWDRPGAAVLRLVENSLFVDGEEVVDVRSLWVDRENLIVHSVRDLPGSMRQIEAFSLERMQPIGEPLVLPASEAPDWNTNVTAYDTGQDRLLYRRTGESGMPRWFRFDLAGEEYEAGLLGDPQMSETAFVGANSQRLVWDPIRDRGYRVQRIVPPGVPSNEFDNHRWTLFAYAEGEDGVWTRKSFELPSFPAGQNQTGFPTTSLNPANYAVASDGSLIALASTRSGLAASESIPGAYRIVFDAADEAVSVQPLPGVEVLNTILAGGTFSAVQTSANGHILLIRMAAGGEVVHCRIDGEGGVGCDDPVSIRDNVEAGPYDERRYALDADGTAWFGGVTSQQLAAVKDGAFAGGQFFQQRHPRGGPVLVGAGHLVYAQTNDGSPGEGAGSRTWGYGKFERLGFVPQLTAQPQPATVELASGEASEQATFSSAASGEPHPQRRWQVKAPGSNRFVDLAGESGETLSVAASRDDDGAEYRAIYENAAGRIASEAAALTVAYAPQLLVDAADVSVVEGADAEISVLPDGNPEPTVTWQRRVDGFWQPIAPGDDNFAIEGPNLTVLDTNADQSGALLRAKLVNPVGTAFSRAARLTVTPRVEIPPEGLDLDSVSLRWSGNAEMQKLPPAGGSNYFSAGASTGGQATYRSLGDNAAVFQVSASGAETLATWSTRAAHVAGGGEQLVRLYGGEARIEPDGSATVRWDGSFSVNFYGGLVPFTFSDPELSVEADGSGRLSADMSGCASSIVNPGQCAPFAPHSDVAVATFSGVEVDPSGEVEVKPDYAGVAVEGEAGKPQLRTGPGWGAWPQDFVDFHLQTGLAAYWYSSGSAFDPDKPPAPFVVDFQGDPLPAAPPVQGPAPSEPGRVPPRGGAGPLAGSVSIAAFKRARRLGRNGMARVARLSCPGDAPCRVRAPRRLRLELGGRRHLVRVLVPRRIGAGGRAVLRLKLSRGALREIASRRRATTLRFPLRSAAQRYAVRVKLRRSGGDGVRLVHVAVRRR